MQSTSCTISFYRNCASRNCIGRNFIAKSWVIITLLLHNLSITSSRAWSWCTTRNWCAFQLLMASIAFPTRNVNSSNSSCSRFFAGFNVTFTSDSTFDKRARQCMSHCTICLTPISNSPKRFSLTQNTKVLLPFPDFYIFDRLNHGHGSSHP